MQPATVDETEIFAKLLKFIELAPQQQTGAGAIEPDEPTKPGATTASTAPGTQAPSSASASPAPQPDRQPDPPPSTPEPASQSDPAPEPLSIVDRCVNAYNKARSETYARTEDRFAAKDAGSMAYRNAMPPLRGADNIRDFIACVAQALLFGVIKDKDASKLLYAAQVAFSTEKQPSPKRAPKTAPETTAPSSAKN